VSRVPDEGAQVAAVTDERVELTLSTTNFEKAAQIGRDLADASAARRTAWFTDREWAIYGITHLIADHEERNQ
jgi:hypothetical protein